MHNTKTWTQVPGTGVSTLNLTYVMGSYTATAKYGTRWNHRGGFVSMVEGYRLHGPGFPPEGRWVYNLPDARWEVRHQLLVAALRTQKVCGT